MQFGLMICGSGGALIGILLYGESKYWRRMVFIVLGAAIALKLYFIRLDKKQEYTLE